MRTARRAVVAGALLLALVAGGCSGGGDTSAPETLTPPGGREVEPLTAEQDEAVATARTWLEGTSGLDPQVLGTLRPGAVDSGMGVAHVHFGQVIDDHAVRDAEIVVHVLDDGTVQGASDALTAARPAADARMAVTKEAAAAVAAKAVTGTPSGPPIAEAVWLEDGDALRLTWTFAIATRDPMGAWEVVVDATTNEVLEARADGRERVVRRPTERPSPAVGGGADAACELPAAPSACVFLPDPIFAAGGELDDLSDANDHLAGVPLLGLADPESGRLVGEYVDVQPRGAPVEPTLEADGTWAGGRGTRGFEAAMAYWWIDHAQRELQRLDLDVRDERFPVVPIDPDLVDNAFYTPVEEQIYLGVGSDGINEGEDAAGILHEYGHAVLDEIQPALLGGDGDAIHEGFADAFAYLVSLEWRTGDAPCLFAWAEEQRCLRRVDGDGVYPDDLVQEPHLDGELYSGAIHDVFAALLEPEGLAPQDCPGSTDCDDVRDRVLATLVASGSYLTGDARLPDAAAAFEAANEAASGGAEGDVIAAAFAAHGLDGGSGGMDIGEGGEGVESGFDGVAVELQIAHDYRGDLAVEVVVLDADGDELCAPEVIAEPDEDDAANDLTGLVDLSDAECAEHAPPDADRQWVLRVRDTLEEDEGEVIGFTVYDGETPYAASGLPVAIPDADADGVTVVVDDGVDQGDGTEDEEPAVGDGPIAEIAIAHTYVGDLSVRVGALDEDGKAACVVRAHEPDAADAGEDLELAVDLGECAGAYPPTAEAPWFLEVIDDATLDRGSVESFVLVGPGGEELAFAGVPVDVPDDDPDGVVLLLDDAGGAPGQMQGSGQGDEDDEAQVTVVVEHPYRGDLAVRLEVTGDRGDVLCREELATPDPGDGSDDLDVTAPAGSCAEHFPPTAERPWTVVVVDTLREDEGTLELVELIAPGGDVLEPDDRLPVDVPDDDPDGVVVDFTGG